MFINLPQLGCAEMNTLLHCQLLRGTCLCLGMSRVRSVRLLMQAFRNSDAGPKPAYTWRLKTVWLSVKCYI